MATHRFAHRVVQLLRRHCHRWLRSGPARPVVPVHPVVRAALRTSHAVRCHRDGHRPSTGSNAGPPAGAGRGLRFPDGQRPSWRAAMPCIPPILDAQSQRARAGHTPWLPPSEPAQLPRSAGSGADRCRGELSASPGRLG
ncbi:hypothetical protein G6F63_015730 [Rhizopus arrhizus]|nr:hypothetical protein G6F63_015730 [Rhizopus arrhizus]